MSRKNDIAIMLPAGQYYIGDPCYVVGTKNHELWMDFLYKTGLISDTDECTEGYCTYEGHELFAASTAFGDGSFEDNEGYNYPVDAGMIGVIPIALTDDVAIESKKLGRIETFARDFEVSRTQDGVFVINRNIVINTGDWNTNDEEDCDEE